MPIFRRFLLTALMILCALTASGCGKSVDLYALRDWDIVVSDDAIPSERYAAEEFQRIYALARGETIPIRAAPGTAAGHIFIGPGAGQAAKIPAFSPPLSNDEDLAIAIAETSIWITGGRPRGTLYGVYSFLENHLGVRFLTHDHTHVPTLKPGTAIQTSRQTFHPPFEFRNSFYGENARDLSFAARLRSNTLTDDAKLGGRTPMRLINHSFAHYVPWKKYGVEHPEYYNELPNGKRPENVTDEQFNPGIQLCLTNPDVLRIVTEGVLRDLAAQPHLRNISVSQNDNYSFCRCVNCRAIDEREGTPMGSLLTFVNAVADEVAKKHPQVFVGTLAYQYSRKPPRTVRPRANVQIQLCSIECCMNHPLENESCPLNKPFLDDMNGWSKISDKIYVWYYITNFANYLLPCPNIPILEPDVRYFERHHVRGLLMQGAYNVIGGEFSDLRNYVTSRLIWDPSQSGEKLTDEFLDLHYAEAAGPIRDYLKFAREKVLASGKHERCSRAGMRYGLDRSVAEFGLRKFADALALAKSEPIKRRVELASLCAHAMMIDALLDGDSQMTIYWRLRKNKPLLPEIGTATAPGSDMLVTARPHIRRLFEICDRYNVTMVGEWISVPQAKQMYRKLYGLAENEPF